MKQLKLLGKTYVAATAIAVVAAGSIGLCALGMSLQAEAIARMDEGTALLRSNMEADMLHDAIHAEVAGIVAAGSSPAFNARESAVELQGSLIEFEQKMAVTASFAGAPAIRAARNAAQQDYLSYLETSRQIAQGAKAGQQPSPAQLRQFQADFGVLEASMAKISDAVEAYVAGIAVEAQSSALYARLLALGGLAAMIAALVLIVRICRRRVIAPVYSLMDSMGELSRENYWIEVSGCNRSDEIGDLANAVADLGRGLQRIREEKTAQSVSVVATIGKGLSRMAARQLDEGLDEVIEGPFEDLRQDFNSALASLSTTLVSVRNSTGHLQDVAEDIGRSAGDLATRNMQQAANLEETAAAITALNGRVGDSTQAVRHARDAVDEVGSEVTRSGQVIEQAEEAMDRIEHASREIAKIISVIDGIAFQTNLLALNAGVEAARAGESGKGFAVVAHEVRALAQRSAEAANEIKALIGNSSSEVSEGVRLVRDAGSGLRAITDQMERINRVMEQVHASATEQSATLQTINATAQQMDQITQSNAAAADDVLQSSRSVVDAVRTVAGQIDQFVLAPGEMSARPPATSVRALAA